jgi:hypothetical protein
MLTTASAEPAGKATLRLVIVDQTNAVLSHAAVTTRFCESLTTS